MQIARVVGTVVSTTKSDRLTGLKMLLVKPIDLDTFEEKGNVLVAFDAVGAGEGEVVMICSGSSIIAIIDYIDLRNKRIFSKL